MKKIYFVILIFLFSLGCLGIETKECDQLIEGSINRDDCFKSAAVSTYLKTGNRDLSKEICLNELSTNKTKNNCITLLGISAAYHNNSNDAIHFCSVLLNRPERSPISAIGNTYEDAVECYSEIAYILGKPALCDSIGPVAEETIWYKRVQGNEIELCKIRAELNKKRIENPPSWFN